MLAHRHAAEIEAIRRDVLDAAATTPREERALVIAGGSPPGWESFLAKVRGESYRVTDEDVQALRRAGFSEDAIFELTVAASVGVAYERLLTARRALDID